MDLAILHFLAGFSFGLLMGLALGEYVIPWAVKSWNSLRHHAR